MKIALWIVGVSTVVAVLLALFGHKKVRTEIVISASADVVWSVLIDAPRYKEWNPVIFKVEGAYGKGATMTNHVNMPGADKPTVMKSRVVGMTRERELNQFGGVRGVLTFDHKWVLIPVKDGTQVIQQEEYRGLGVWFWDAKVMEAPYAKANQALKARVLQILKERKQHKSHPK